MTTSDTMKENPSSDTATSEGATPPRGTVPSGDDRLTNDQLLRALDGLRPLFNATGPAQGGRTFSGWEVPDWLMQNIRAALRESLR